MPRTHAGAAVLGSAAARWAGCDTRAVHLHRLPAGPTSRSGEALEGLSAAFHLFLLKAVGTMQRLTSFLHRLRGELNRSLTNSTGTGDTFYSSFVSPSRGGHYFPEQEKSFIVTQRQSLLLGAPHAKIISLLEDFFFPESVLAAGGISLRKVMFKQK